MVGGRGREGDRGGWWVAAGPSGGASAQWWSRWWWWRRLRWGARPTAVAAASRPPRGIRIDTPSIKYHWSIARRWAIANCAVRPQRPSARRAGGADLFRAIRGSSPGDGSPATCPPPPPPLPPASHQPTTSPPVTRLPMLPPPSRWSAGRAPASAPLVPKPWQKRSSGLGKRAPRPMRSSESTASQRDINRRLESEWLSREKVSHAWRCTLSFSSTWCFCAFISRASLCTTPLNPYVCTQKNFLSGIRILQC